VGCVLVGDDGRLIARGWTQPGGRPHAETEALARAGEDARGSCAYVTLEPCAHSGQTPPCAGALIEAGVARVVIACQDPDPRVSGRGIAMLEAAGITVTAGVLADEARTLNAGFLSRLERGRPHLALKMATSLDGRIATRGGQSKWITGAPARRYGHLLRAHFDAVLVGAGTARADDPALDCRLAGLEDASPLRLVADSHLRLDPAGKLARSAQHQPTWAITLEPADSEKARALAALGVEIITTAPDDAGRPDMARALKALAERGLTRVLVEGGGGLAAALLRAGLVDELYWFHAGLTLGGDAMAAIGPLEIEALDSAPRWRRTGIRRLGQDLLETFAANP
jgi:diaminohydroxyphosphoribosylaminopyrimidine deaminase/5-amino-6-(5-phosphoribosylamino)uracil reductase